MAKGAVCVLLFLTICSGYSANNPHYMDVFCDQSLYLKNHKDGLDLHLTESEFYGSDLNCSLRLVARTHHRIVVTFIYLDISSFVSCPEDFLEIGECLPDRQCEGVCCVLSSLYCCPQHDSKTVKYCGVAVPSTSYTSQSNVITLTFISDAHFFGRGFHLYVTTFHEGTCLKEEVQCFNGRCIPQSIRCSKGDNCGDGTDMCSNVLTPPVIAGFAVGGVITVFTFSIALVILWYYRKHGMETNRYIRRRERYTRRYASQSSPSRFSYTNQMIFSTPTQLLSCVPVMTSPSLTDILAPGRRDS